jgi:hypothetical protein
MLRNTGVKGHEVPAIQGEDRAASAGRKVEYRVVRDSLVGLAGFEGEGPEGTGPISENGAPGPVGQAMGRTSGNQTGSGTGPYVS